MGRVIKPPALRVLVLLCSHCYYSICTNPLTRNIGTCVFSSYLVTTTPGCARPETCTTTPGTTNTPTVVVFGSQKTPSPVPVTTGRIITYSPALPGLSHVYMVFGRMVIQVLTGTDESTALDGGLLKSVTQTTTGSCDRLTTLIVWGSAAAD